MKKQKRGGIVLLALFALTTSVHAEEEKWKDSGDIAYVKTGGNSKVATLSLKNLLTYQFNEKTEGLWKMTHLFGETSGVKTAESYSTELRINHQLAQHAYAAVLGGWLKDNFAGIDPRYYVGPAIGYKILAGPKHFLKTEAGVDYVNEEYRTIPASKADYARGRAFGEYGYHFTETNQLIQSVEYLHDFDISENYNVNTSTAVISALNTHFSMKTSYEVRHDNLPVVGKKKTDSILGASLLVTF